jgi:hypothetical protein
MAAQVLEYETGGSQITRTRYEEFKYKLRNSRRDLSMCQEITDYLQNMLTEARADNHSAVIDSYYGLVDNLDEADEVADYYPGAFAIKVWTQWKVRRLSKEIFCRQINIVALEAIIQEIVSPTVTRATSEARARNEAFEAALPVEEQMEQARLNAGL